MVLLIFTQHCPILQTAFLRQCRPKIGHQSALVALTGMSQGTTKDISSYICIFEMVITWFVGDHMSDDTNCYYFIEGFIQTPYRTRDIELESYYPH